MKQADFNLKLTKAISSKSEDMHELAFQILESDKLSALEALQIYQNDYEIRLTDALKNSYNAIYTILGDHDFRHLSKDYILNYNSLSPNLDDYGEHVSTFLKSHFLHQKFPFLNELAHFEWSFRNIFLLSESKGISELDLMTVLQNEFSVISLTSTAMIFSFQSPILDIINLLNIKDPLKNISVDYNLYQFILMYKNEDIVKTHVLTNHQYYILDILKTPLSVGAFFSKIPSETPPLEIQSLFQLLGSERLIMSSSDQRSNCS
jgi:hypothetical protein